MFMVVKMDINIHIENFDGPMDLLLHLVKSTKLDIYEIQMSEIIENYLNYISTLQELNIDVGSEFLLMASTLIHLKSKMLIGKTEEEENNEDEFSIQSEEDLKNKIIEYEKYKNISKDLQALEEKRKEIYTKIPSNLKQFKRETELVNEDLTIEDLVNAFLNLQKRIHYKEPLETKITKKEISIEERVTKIRDYLKVKKHLFFEELFEVPRKDYVIATFLAILEMSKSKEIRIFQESNFHRIEVESLL